MFLHIGNNVLLRKEDVIGVFSVESLQKDAKGKKYLKEIKKSENVEDISDGKWASLVLTDDVIYVSRIASITLLGRSGGSMGGLPETLSNPPGKSAN